MKTKFIHLLCWSVGTIFCLSLSACGQTGALYLPKAPESNELRN